MNTLTYEEAVLAGEALNYDSFTYFIYSRTGQVALDISGADIDYVSIGALKEGDELDMLLHNLYTSRYDREITKALRNSDEVAIAVDKRNGVMYTKGNIQEHFISFIKEISK